MNFTNIGNQLFRNRDVRDRVFDQQTTLANGTTADVVTAKVGHYHDLVVVTGYNDSDAAVTVLFDDVSDVKFRMTIPAAGAVGNPSQLFFDPPLKQALKNSAWTADMPDTTNTNISLLIQFVRNGTVNDKIS